MVISSLKFEWSDIIFRSNNLESEQDEHPTNYSSLCKKFDQETWSNMSALSFQPTVELSAYFLQLLTTSLPPGNFASFVDRFILFLLFRSGWTPLPGPLVTGPRQSINQFKHLFRSSINTNTSWLEVRKRWSRVEGESRGYKLLYFT